MLLCLPCVGIYNWYCLQTLVKSSVQEICSGIAYVYEKAWTFQFLVYCIYSFHVRCTDSKTQTESLNPSAKTIKGDQKNEDTTSRMLTHKYSFPYWTKNQMLFFLSFYYSVLQRADVLNIPHLVSCLIFFMLPGRFFAINHLFFMRWASFKCMKCHGETGLYSFLSFCMIPHDWYFL